MAEPLILPKSLFENRKNIAIQLTTEPKMSEQKPVTLQPNEDLVIKFEGVVQVGRHVKSNLVLIIALKISELTLTSLLIYRAGEKDQKGCDRMLCDEPESSAFIRSIGSQYDICRAFSRIKRNWKPSKFSFLLIENSSYLLINFLYSLL